MREEQITRRLGWDDFCDDAITVCDQNPLATSGEPNVLAELVLEHLKSDGAHSKYVAPGRFFINLSARFSEPTAMAAPRRPRLAD